MLEFQSSQNAFLGLAEKDAGRPQEAGAVIIPFGLENSVSFEGGMALAPRAILDCSSQIPTFDEVLKIDAYRKYGIATLKEPHVHMELEYALNQISALTDEVVVAGHFPMILGGERTITMGAIRPFAREQDQVTILHFDAHASLHETHEGESSSHATTIRRCLDHPNVRVVSVGIRSLSAEEYYFLEENSNRVEVFWAHERGHWTAEDVAAAVGEGPTYITMGVDVFDSSLMPATSMPEVGGLFWHDAIEILDLVARQRKIIGMDVVELTPRASLHGCNLLVAKLVYKMLNFALLRG